MALETWYDAGTVSVAQGSTTVTASNAYWGDDAIMAGDLFCDPAQPLVPPQRVMSVTDDTTLELWAPWPGTSLTDDTYEIRYVGIIERSTAQTRRVLEQLGEVSAYFDVQVNTLADRAAFDSRPAGFRVLVSDIGDGRAAIYSKDTAVSADWSDAAYFSGPVGPAGPDGPEGVNWRGAWASATAYAVRDGVLYNGSSWRAKQANQNQSPPALPTVENTYWHLVAQKGTDGTGTGDVTGPASSVSGRIAIYNGTTGKQLGQAGVAISDLQPAGSYEPARAKATQAQAEAGTGTTVLGWAPEQIAQMIASRSPPTADLEFTVSQLAIALADATNVAQFLGSNGNRIADSFDNLNYVGAGGAENLDTSAAGILKATSTSRGIDQYTKLLLHGDGSNGATTFPDSSGLGKTITRSGDTQISTAQSKFGGASILFNGTNSNLIGDGTSDYSLAVGEDFTIDLWVRFNTLPSSPMGLVEFRTAALPNNIVLSSNLGRASAYIAGDWRFTTAPVFAINTWYHVALVRSSGVFTLYVDGTAYGTYSNNSAFSAPATGPYFGSYYNAVSYLNGYLDEVRVSKGIARWTAAFTPPTAAYTTPLANNVTVRSVAFSAAAVPTKMKALIQVKEVDAAAAGTDYTLECSRDNGATWASMALTERYGVGNGLMLVEAAETDVSGQPSGTAPRWRFKTLNNKNVELHDVYFYWV